MMNYLVDLQMAQEKPKEIELPPDATSLDLLRAIYRCPTANLQMRIRCAIAALPHEHGRLSVVAVVNEQSFAEVLERRLARIKEMENGNGKLIDAKPQELELRAPLPRSNDRPQIEVRPPLAPTNDRRFRRM
jgi:hypothetical protein